MALAFGLYDTKEWGAPVASLDALDRLALALLPLRPPSSCRLCSCSFTCELLASRRMTRVPDLLVTAAHSSDSGVICELAWLWSQRQKSN